LASFSFALMATLIRVLSENISGLECAVLRSALGSLVLVIFLWWKGESILGRHRKELNTRGLIGSFSNTFYFYSLSGGNLAEIVSLIRTSALMIPFIALWSLSERIKLRHYLCSLAGFVGTLLIVKPGVIAFSSYSISAILCAITGAFAWTSVRALAQREHPGTITLYLYSFSTFSGILTMWIVNDRFVMPNLIEWIYILLLILVGLSAQFALVMAYRYAPAAVVSPVTYSEIVFSAILGWSVFGQKIGLLSLVGIITIVLSATLIQNPFEAYKKWARRNPLREKASY
jgi:drug/metabolite transporter (DMT)-like permease